MRFAIAAILVAVMAIVSVDANAANCPSKPTVSVELTGLDSGMVLIPALLAREEVLLKVDTGGVVSTLKSRFIDEHKLPRYAIRRSRIKDVSGERLDTYVGVRPMQLGDLTRSGETRFLESRAGDPLEIAGRRVVGTFANDFMRNYDVDLDFTRGRFGLYPSWCGPKAVGPAEHYRAIPFQSRFGVPVVTVTLAGRKISAVFDTGSRRSILDWERARETFGLEIGDPGVEVSSPVTVISGNQVETHSYTFKSLALGGLELGEAEIALADLGRPRYGGTLDMTLGMSEIGKLHVYIAYAADETIYATKN
jgi:hypothetical protein